MFGKLFDQKKEDDQNAAAPQQGQATQYFDQPPPGQQQVAPNQPAQQVVAQQPVAPTPTPQASPADNAASPIQSQVSPPVDGATSAQQQEPIQPDTSAALTHLDPLATQVLTRAQEETKRINQQFIEPEQILLAIINDQQTYKLLDEFKIDGGALSKEIQSKETMGVFKSQPTLSPVSQKIFDASYKDAKNRGSNFVTPQDIFIQLLSKDYPVSNYLTSKGLMKEAVIEKMAKNADLNYSHKTILETYATDLTEEARTGKLDPVAGREKEVDRIVHILLRRTKNNPIIIGETGVGKTAIVEGLAQQIAAGQVPKDLQNKRVFQLDVSSLIAGASHRGEFEERLRGVVNEVMGSNNTIILFIDEIHSLLGTGDGEGMSAANIIKPHLARGHLQMIGATTTIEYRKNFAKDKAFERRFQPVTAEEPSEENAVEMLKVLRQKYEKFHKVEVSDDTLVECVKLSKKYIGERYLPDKAVDLLDEACSEVKLQIDAGKRKEAQVRKGDIEKVVSIWTGIPITKLTEDESQKLLKLEDRIHKRLIDQEQAVVAVAEAVRRGRIGLAAANRPIASFIFLGPTGTGKTELAKTLAELLFGRDDAMARLDMSEYMEKHEVAKLIGAPPGYVGYEEGGQLTEAVRKKPYSIVLLDEIEKAHPDVFNILLQLLEDGRLTDNKGNTISFKNTIVICTSNIGSSLIQQKLNEHDSKTAKTKEESEKLFEELTALAKEELVKFFRPELLNRFDETVIFRPLLLEHMAGITRLGIKKTAGLLKEQGYNLQITEKAIAQLAKDGYDPVYGARPLRRLIQTAIENPVALEIISKRFTPGDTILIDYDSEKNTFVFTKGEQSKVFNSENIKKTLMGVLHPETASEDDKEKLKILHDKVEEAAKNGNELAARIMAMSDATTAEETQKIMDDLKVAREKEDPVSADILAYVNAVLSAQATVEQEADPMFIFKKKLQQIANPLYTADEKDKEKFNHLNDMLTKASQENNEWAKTILALTDQTSDTDIEKIKTDLEKAKANGDQLAINVLQAISDSETAEVAGSSQEETTKEPVAGAEDKKAEGVPPVPVSVADQPKEVVKPAVDSSKGAPFGLANAPSAPDTSHITPVESVVADQPVVVAGNPAPVEPTPPASGGATLSQSAGMTALNEHLEKENNIISTSVESDGENIS